MKLNITGDVDRGPEYNELNKNSKGGTELMLEALYDQVPADLLDKFQIIPSRVRQLKDKRRILWLHDLPQDPESQHLKDGGWDKFEKIVYVSHWQKQQYQNYLGVPPSKGVVLQNAIVPIEAHQKPDPDECINIIYHTTPHRGLELLVPILEHIEKELPEINWHLDVYSSFSIYGWSERDKPYEQLFDTIRNHPRMTYHGAVSNQEVREALKKAHIFCLPSIWPETSCIAMLEAMSAGCICVHSSLAALPETAANWTLMYDYNEVPNEHAGVCAGTLHDALRLVSDPSMKERLNMQKAYIDGFYTWEVRSKQWQVMLMNVLSQPSKQMSSTDKK